MKRSMLLVLCVAVGLSRGQVNQDPGGWSHARWGMSEGEVWQAFKGEARRIGPMEIVAYRLTIDKVEIGRWKFAARFIFTDGQLVAVDLEAHDKQPCLEVFGDLSRLLLEKYGQPVVSDSDGIFVVSRTRTWLLPTTSIILHIIESRAQSALRLSYRKRNRGSIDKL